MSITNPSARPIVAVLHFGDKPRDRARLDRWLTAYKDTQAATQTPFVVITDGDTRFPGSLFPDLKDDQIFRTRMCHADLRDLVRTGEPGEHFDRKGAIIWDALLRLQRPVLYLDSDTELRADIGGALLDLHAHECIMAPDVFPGLCNAGVMWFGKQDHSETCARYRAAFMAMRFSPPPAVDLLEQFAWNAIKHSRRLDPVFNWQPHFHGPNPEALIYHRHGGDHKISDGVRTPNQEVINRPRIVVIGTPHTGTTHDLHRDFLNDLMGVKPENEIYIRVSARCSCVARGRDFILAEALRLGATDVVFVDSDIVGRPSDVVRLLSHDVDIVGGLYSLKQHPARWVLDELPGEPVRSDGLLQVRDIGTGFKRIRTSALRRMIYKHPQIQYDSDVGPGEGDRGRTMWNFSWQGVVAGRFLSEDYGFDHLAGLLGIPIFADTRVVAQHWGMISYPLVRPELPGGNPRAMIEAIDDRVYKAAREKTEAPSLDDLRPSPGYDVEKRNTC